MPEASCADTPGPAFIIYKNQPVLLIHYLSDCMISAAIFFHQGPCLFKRYGKEQFKIFSVIKGIINTAGISV